MVGSEGVPELDLDDLDDFGEEEADGCDEEEGDAPAPSPTKAKAKAKGQGRAKGNARRSRSLRRRGPPSWAQTGSSGTRPSMA